MSLHTNSNGYQRKAVLAVNGPLDNDLVVFNVVVDLGSSGAETVVLPDRAIPAGHRTFVEGFSLTSDGNAWTGGTSITLADGGDGGNIPFATVATANLPTASAPIRFGSLGTVTAGGGLATGSRAGKGLTLRRTGTFSGPAILKLNVWGWIRPNQAEQVGTGV